MRKFIVLPLLVLLAACTERTAVGPDGDPGFVAAKGGIPGPPKKDKPPPDEEPPAADPADPAIAFNTYGRETGYCLRVMNDDGSNDTRLICGSGGGMILPSWSPYGTSLAFVNRETQYELWRMDVAVVNGVPQGSKELPLATCAWDPAWSPVGVPSLGGKEVIAYQAIGQDTDCRKDELRYVCADANGAADDCSGTLHTTASGAAVRYPAWSPDATKIAFVESRDPNGSHGWRIQIKDLGTLVDELVFDGEGEFWEIWDLDWSRDGGCLAFSAASARNKRRSNRHVYTLSVSDAPKSCEPGLTQIIEGGSGVAWSPNDGSLVVKSGGDLVKVNLTDYSTETLRRGGFHPDWWRNPPPAPVP